LRKATKEVKAHSTVVLSGLMLKGYNDDNKLTTLGEFDFIVISLPLKSIIQIEAKRGNNEKNREHADIQLKRGKEFFAKNCPFPESENWKYTKMMCFGETVEKDICDQCKHFVLSADFIKTNMTQPVSKPIADQFKTFWEDCKVYPGIIKHLLKTSCCTQRCLGFLVF
jgi:hypothetical protein